MKSVRVFFEKTGDLKFVSHLDLNRFMIRMVRLSGIPVWYSEGFNPHPYITFALPLSLGFESTYEIMDIRLDDDDYPCSEVFNNLCVKLPKGLKMTSCCEPVMKSGDVAYAKFVLDFGDGFSAFADKLKEFMMSRSIIAEKRTKKGGLKTVDLQEMIHSWSFTENGIELVLAAGGSNNLNPKLLIETFGEKSGTDLPLYSVTRVGLYNSKMELFV